MNRDEVPEQKESIKLTKNTKGYSWEIKVFRIEDESDAMLMTRLAIIEAELKLKFGEKSNVEIEK